MIERHAFLDIDYPSGEPKEIALLSIISQSFVQPFSVEDNLLVILTALTSGSGIGFNRAMLFRAEDEALRGEAWLGPRSPDEAKVIWEVLSTPGIGYVEIIEHNRALLSSEASSLSARVRPLRYSLRDDPLRMPALSVARRETLLVREARTEPLVDPEFMALIDVDEFLCVPLFVREETLGVIILDNAYSRQRIEPRAVHLAGLCGLLAGNHLYAARLHRRFVDMEKMAALGEMASFITHQLRNPMAVIGGFAGQILEGGLDDERCRRNLEIIRREVFRAEDILTKLGRLFRIDRRANEPFSLESIIAAIGPGQEIPSKAGGSSLRIEVEPGLPLVLGDRLSAGEAVRNLVANAGEATETGGDVVVSARREGRAWVVVSVTDTGTGLTPEAKDHLFQPFFTTKETGMGLGLIYVKRVMEACGGRIEVESEPGRGTVVRLFFRIVNEGRTEI
jgi:hypothetical protein